MVEVIGRLRTPRLATAPTSPAVGEMYYDTATNQLKWWDGTAWQIAGGTSAPTIYDSDPIGTIKAFSGKTIPQNWVIANGGTYSEASYPDLAVFAAAEVAAGNPLWGISGTAPSRTVTIPDLRRRMLYGSNSPSLADIGVTGGEETHALTIAELAAHDHGAVTGNDSPDHAHLADHAHQTQMAGGAGGNAYAQTSGGTVFDSGAGSPVKFTSGFYTSGASARHAHSIPAQGSGTAHNTLPPYVLVAQIVKIKGATINAGGALVGATGPVGPKGDPGPWRGAWAAATAYAVGDSVNYIAANGTTATYRRKVAGTTSTTPDIDTTNWDLIASAGSSGGATYTTTIGDGSTTVFTITHNLNSADAFVAVRENASPFSFVYPEVRYVDANTLSLIFDVAPASGAYRVSVIIGGAAGQPVSGAAGGDLSGTYPNPQIAAGIIVNGDIAAAAAIAATKLGNAVPYTFYDATLGAAAQFDIGSIPQTHSTLRVEIYAIANGTANDVICIRPNADSSASHYSQRIYNANGSNGGDQNNGESFIRGGWIPGTTVGGLGFTYIEIPNYTSSTQLKRYYGMYSMYDGTSNVVAVLGGSHFPNTTPITRVWLFPLGSGNNFGPGSRCVVKLI